VQFACNFYLAQWYRECSSAITKSFGTLTETASVVSESASTDVPQRKKRKKKRRPSDDSENAADAASVASGHYNDPQMELKQEQQWLLSHMHTGLTSVTTTRFVCHFQLFTVTGVLYYHTVLAADC